MLDKLLEAILLGTKDGTIIWNRTNSSFNTDKDHTFECALNSETMVSLRVKLNDTVSDYSSTEHIILTNKKLVEGRKYINGQYRNAYGNQTIISIGKEVFNRYIKPNIKACIPEDCVFGDILSDMPNKSQLRDEKINDIIDSTEPIIKVSEPRKLSTLDKIKSLLS